MSKKWNEDAKREFRSMPVRELRVNEDGKKITGYASIFNEETEIASFFREVIRPGAFKRAIRENQNVYALKNHDPNLILARTANDSLALKEDKKGLWIEFDPPDTQTGRDMVEEIRTGLVDEMSFAFMSVEEKWTEKKDELSLREIIDVDLFDVSPVTYAQYQGTSIGLRSAESIFNDHIQSLEGQVPEGDDDAEREGQELDRARAIVEVLKLKQ
jgi:hypothetical protein